MIAKQSAEFGGGRRAESVLASSHAEKVHFQRERSRRKYGAAAGRKRQGLAPLSSVSLRSQRGSVVYEIGN